MKETRKLAAIMFTDIVGYSALMSKDEKLAMEVLEKNREIHKAAIKKFLGQYIKEIGDGTLSIFQSSVDAVSCALEIQKVCCTEQDFQVRIGIHIGDIIFRDNDVFGDAVNIASRIESSGKSYGICISEKVYDDIRNKTEIKVKFPEERSLKNIPYPVKIYTVVSDPVLSEEKEPFLQKINKQAEKSIIVLPFENLSPDPDQEYFSDGLTEEIITDLSQIHELLVISRSSAMTFKGTRKKMKEIAKEVNVRYVLEGSVRKSGNNLRITAQLIDANSDMNLWAEKFSGTLDDVFDIQEKVSRSIVDRLKLKLSEKEDQQISERPIDDIKGFECYLKARHEIWKWKENALDQALEYIKSGIEIVGDNAVLYAGMAYVYWQYYNLGLKQEEFLKKAKKYTSKAFELDPDSPYGHLVFGLISIFYNVNEGVRHLKKVLTYDPNNFDALAWLVLIYTQLGKSDLAIHLMENLKKIDPFNPLNQFFQMRMQVYKGDFQVALISAAKYHQSFKEDPAGRIFYALTLAYTGHLNEAFNIFDMISTDSPHHVLGKLSQILKFGLQLKGKEVKMAIDPEMEKMAERDFVFSHWISDSYALIGESQKALDWLETAVNQGMINWPFLNEYDPFLENVRDENRFKMLMERVKKEWEDFES